MELAPGKALRIDGGKASDAAAYLSLGGYGAFSIDAPGMPGGRLVVQDSGNVGIGTASPENSESWNKVADVLGSGSAKLSVRTGGGIDARVQASDAGLGNWPAGMVIGTRSAHSLSFGTSGTPRMTIDSGGNGRHRDRQRRRRADGRQRRHGWHRDRELAAAAG